MNKINNDAAVSALLRIRVVVVILLSSYSL